MNEIAMILGFVLLILSACSQSDTKGGAPYQNIEQSIGSAALETPMLDSAAYIGGSLNMHLEWEDLMDVMFEPKYSSEAGDTLLFPLFSPKVRAYNGKSISLEGYLIPLDETGIGDAVILSALPYTSCFFCGVAGPESVMDIVLQDPTKIGDLDMDAYVSATGRLRLNDSDINRLYYILEEAKLERYDK